LEADVLIAVGSNIEPLQNIPAALDLLQQEVQVAAVSTFYRSEPLGGRSQPAYANGAFLIRGALRPRVLKFDLLRSVEANLGRTRGADKYASRPIDLDIAIHGDLVIAEPDLVIPDPDIYTRDFVALPLLELAPDLILPDSGEPLATLDVVKEGADLQPMPELTAELRAMVESRLPP